MNRENNLPTLEQLAAVKRFDIIFKTYEIFRRKKHLLCYCHMQEIFMYPTYTVCQICNFSPFWFKDQTVKNRKYLIETFRCMLNWKERVIKKVGHRNIFFNHDYEYAFFNNKFCQNLRLLHVVSPYEIIF